jgi:7-carboxy-7-deazaguanine synthase
LEEKYEVTLETGGSLPIYNVPMKVTKIVDFKCPSSGMENKNLWSIINDIQLHDEIKFVIGDIIDFNWAKEKISKYNLDGRCTLLMSPTFGKIDPSQIAEWILKEGLPVRMQLQMHKHIWDPKVKGV